MNSRSRTNHHQQQAYYPHYPHTYHHNQYYYQHHPLQQYNNYHYQYNASVHTQMNQQYTNHQSYYNNNDEEKKHTFISTFDVTPLMQYNGASSKTKIKTKRILFYCTDPSKGSLDFNHQIKPTVIEPDSIHSMRGVDLNRIQIDYSSVRRKNKKIKQMRFARSLNEQYPPKYCQNIFNRIDPFCYEIQKILKALNLHQSKGSRFVTYRHNLRAIANVALCKLIKWRSYDRCGINIGVYRKGNDIILENVTEVDDSHPDSFNVNSIYGYLLEHTLEYNAKSNNKDIKSVQPMDYHSKCMERREIRALNEMVIGNDVVCLCAAEMDATMKNNQTIEIKCSNIRKKGRGKIPEISDGKLLKYWTQCQFGGVDHLVVAFHNNGIVQKTVHLTTKDIEDMFPVVTSKCIALVHDVLKWTQKVMMSLPEHKLHLISFDTNNSNSKFFLRTICSKETEMKFSRMVSSKREKHSDVLLRQGLIIQANKREIKIKDV